MNELTDNDGMPQVRWVGDIDKDSPTLGLPVLEDVSTRTLYEATPETGTYSHHSYITHHNATLYASWSNHARDEDGAGQRVLSSISADGGDRWTEPTELFPPRDEIKTRAEQDDEKDRVVIANGFAVVDDTLYAVGEVHLLGESRVLTPPAELSVPEDAPEREFRPRPGLGRIARSIGPEGERGRVFWLLENPPEPRSGFASFPSASHPEFADTASRINAFLARPENWPSWEFVNHTTRPWAPDGHRLCEPTQAWHLPDGGMMRLWRDLSRGSGCQYMQFSPDGGENWLGPVRAEFPDAYSRAAAGNLPDGTAYVINNPGEGRDPLVISLAGDGVNFDRHGVIACDAPPLRYEGQSKGPGFQYPRATVAEDSLFVMYSVNKEDVEVKRISLTELNDWA